MRVLIRLTEDFNSRATAQLEAIARHVAAGPAAAGALPFDIEKLPPLDLARWNGARVREFNCLNFALDLQPESFPRLLPGDIWRAAESGQAGVEVNAEEYDRLKKQIDFGTYARAVLDNVARDGLRPMGDEIGVREGFPVALFLRSEAPPQMVQFDFHWYALRRKADGDNGAVPVWAHKLGWTQARQCSSERNLQDIFANARYFGYQYFAGFHEVDPAKIRAAALSGLRPLRPPFP